MILECLSDALGDDEALSGVGSLVASQVHGSQGVPTRRCSAWHDTPVGTPGSILARGGGRRGDVRVRETACASACRCERVEGLRTGFGMSFCTEYTQDGTCERDMSYLASFAFSTDGPASLRFDPCGNGVR